MKARRIRAYLSGGMEYAKEEGMQWRKELEGWMRKVLGHTVFNPNTQSEKLLARTIPKRNIRRLKSIDITTYTQVLKRIVDLDSREIAENADYVVCYWDAAAQQGAGTKGELTLARFFRKPVYLVTTFDLATIPGWVLGCTTQIFYSFDALKQFLQTSFAGNHSRPRRPSRNRSIP